jgi:DNA-binding response OmpR family regulator
VSRVLLLEDHPRLAEMIRLALERVGVGCDVWASLDQAWAALQMQPYAAALVDRGLPDGDGLTLVRRWRQAGQYLPCLIITARDALHDRVEGLEAGADDYLSKPFSIEELVARTRALLRRPAQQHQLSPTYMGLQLLTDQAVLRFGDQSVFLPNSELQIMSALLEAKGRPVSRSTLEAAAWGLHVAVTPGALDVALHRLRKKLKSMDASVQIHNLRAVGYAMGT